jgi:hypothetical protein
MAIISREKSLLNKVTNKILAKAGQMGLVDKKKLVCLTTKEVEKELIKELEKGSTWRYIGRRARVCGVDVHVIEGLHGDEVFVVEREYLNGSF